MTLDWRTLVAIGVVLVAAAFAIGWLAPEKRRRLRGTVIIFLLLVLSELLQLVLLALDFGPGAAWAASVSELLTAFAVINLTTIAIFDLVLPRFGIDVANILGDVLVGLAYLVAVFVTLRHADLDLTGLVATSAVATGVIGLALSPTIGNILGGVALQVDGSVRVGDWVKLDATTSGRVKEIRWRHTVVETHDWDTVIVPNMALLSGNIVILGKRAGAPSPHRQWVYFNVDFRSTPAEVIAAVDEALQASPIANVAADPAPHTICHDLARESSALYAVRYWLTELAVDDPTNSRVRERIVAGLKRAGISLAIPAEKRFISDDEAHRARSESVEIAHKVEMIRRLDLFQSFNDAELSEIAARLRRTPFAQGEIMTGQGRAPHWLYILSSGRASVDFADGAGSRRVAVLEAPDFFGERGAMTGQPRAATVSALTAVECYRLEKADFQRILSERKELARSMSEVLARRATELDSVAGNLSEEQRSDRMKENRRTLFRDVEAFFGLA